MHRRLNYLFVLSIIVSLLSSCDEKPEDNSVNLPIPTDNFIFIGYEGIFNQGNAGFNFLDLNKNTTIENAFAGVNNRNLGDVLQSIYLKDDEVYLVVNNSAKIEVINRNTLKAVRTITGLTSPRYMAFAGNKAYVSGMYTNDLTVINPITGQIIKKIAIGGPQEDLLLSGNILYVTDYNHSRVLLIDTLNDYVVDTLNTSDFPTSLTLDHLNRIWIGCNSNGSVPSKVYGFDKFNNKICEKNVSGAFIRKVTTGNQLYKTLYVLTDRLYTVSLMDTNFTFQELISNPGNGHNFYGLGIDPKSQDIYLSDALNFSQPSRIIRYDLYGSLKGEFKAGINTSSFLFYHEK